MGGAPYRSPTAPPSEGAGESVELLARLGSLRSSHRRPPLGRSLAMPGFVAAAVGGVVGSVGLSAKTSSAVPFALGGAAAALTFLIVAWESLRDRHVCLDLHAHGLVLKREGARSIVFFDDVDEVWFALERASGYVGEIAQVAGLRFVDRAGKSTFVPLKVEGADAIVRWVHRHCSAPLLDEARKALGEGKPLTFGDVIIDAAGVSVAGAAAPWRELRLVRLQPGRVIFFRRLPLVPWRTVDWTTIPHPTVFVRLVMALAPNVEIDNPVGVEEDP
jgi:hypothetical protein